MSDKKQIKTLATAYLPYIDAYGLYSNAPKHLRSTVKFAKECGFLVDEVYWALQNLAIESPVEPPATIFGLLDWAAECAEIERLEQRASEKKNPPTDLKSILETCFKLRMFEAYDVVYRSLQAHIDEFNK